MKPREKSVHAAEKEHASLKKTVEDAGKVVANRLVGVHDIPQVMATLCEQIEHHFDMEEKAGLFEDITAKAPRLSGRVEELRREHEALRLALSELRRESLAGDGADGWWEQLESRFQRLHDELTAHEVKEHQLLQDAYLVDIGSQD